MRHTTLGIVGAVCIASIASAADLPGKGPSPGPSRRFMAGPVFMLVVMSVPYGRGPTGSVTRFLMCSFWGISDFRRSEQHRVRRRSPRRIQLAIRALVGRGYRSGLVVD